VNNSLLVFTATYNESKNITKFLNSIYKVKLKFDLLLVDDNSPDGTANVVSNFKRNKNKNIILKIRKKKLGLNTAHKYAFNYAKKEGYKYLITLDADLSHQPKLIPIIFKNLINYSFIIGSRYVKGGSCQLQGFRLMISFLGNKLIKYLFNFKIDEFTTSYRGFNFNKLKGFNINIVNSSGYSFFFETVFHILSSGYTCKQVPINFRQRYHGASKMPKIEIIRTLANIIRLKFTKI
jgi:dolichol-phosphate mannosyltransferase